MERKETATSPSVLKPENPLSFEVATFTTPFDMSQVMDMALMRLIIISPEIERAENVILSLTRYPKDEKESKALGADLSTPSVRIEQLFMMPDAAVKAGQGLLLTAHHQLMVAGGLQADFNCTLILSVTLPEGEDVEALSGLLSQALMATLPKGSKLAIAVYNQEAKE